MLTGAARALAWCQKLALHQHPQGPQLCLGPHPAALTRVQPFPCPSGPEPCLILCVMFASKRLAPGSDPISRQPLFLPEFPHFPGLYNDMCVNNLSFLPSNPHPLSLHLSLSPSVCPHLSVHLCPPLFPSLSCSYDSHPASENVENTRYWKTYQSWLSGDFLWILQFVVAFHRRFLNKPRVRSRKCLSILSLLRIFSRMAVECSQMCFHTAVSCCFYTSLAGAPGGRNLCIWSRRMPIA